MRRALPGWCVDLIRDGVRGVDLRKHGNGAVDRETNRICLSAMACEQTLPEIDALIFEIRSNLATQLCWRRGKPLSNADGRKRLHRIWARAAAYRASHRTPWTAEERTAEAVDRADALAKLTADRDADLHDADRAVIRYAVDRAREFELVRVPMPWRTIAATTGRPRRQIANALQRVDRIGLLRLAVRGRGCVGCPANLYDLADRQAVHKYSHRSIAVNPERSISTAANPQAVPKYVVPHRGTPEEMIMEGMRTVQLSNGAVLVLPPSMTIAEAAELDELLRARQLTASAEPEPPPNNVRPIRRAHDGG